MLAPENLAALPTGIAELTPTDVGELCREAGFDAVRTARTTRAEGGVHLVQGTAPIGG